MARDPRYDILFEPVRIGPLTTRNRFYQVPHCNGMGYRDLSAAAAMREVKAEGGWAVVCTEQAEIHPSSDITPFIELRLWDDRDIPGLARISEAIHRHGALAGIELAYNGMNGPNFYSREVPMGPSHLPIATFTADPVQARAMDKEDIANLRRWHRQAALRARRAGFEIVYVYAAHGFGTVQHFLSRRYNTRTDEYGGSLVNRVRLLRELIEDTREALGETCAVAVRITVDELLGPVGLHKEETAEMIGLIAELPDLWDFTLGGWDNDSGTSRFAEEGYQEPFIAGLKSLTSKPVVGVGRFTSPDAMVRQIRKGLLDLIGAARPSIADPFLPRKIEEGRIEDIRECIGCNICVSGDMTMAPIRCTQNPSMGEEWRRGWHPERIRPRRSDARVLVVGAGPAGLECARALGQRGYKVTLAEAGRELGGRVTKESRLPHAAAWGRVRDHRLQQIAKLPDVEVFKESRLDAAQVLELGHPHVAIATGSLWRRDGIARYRLEPLAIDPAAQVLTPDDLMSGAETGGRVLVYDDDHYYMGGLLAELLLARGADLTLMTPASEASTWSRNTLEQHRIQARLLKLGARIEAHQALERIDRGGVTAACVFTGRRRELAADTVVLVTARLPEDALFQELRRRRSDWMAAGILSVTAIGDAWAPSTIAAAVHAGRRYAEELEETRSPDEVPFRREITELARA
ncbi:MAG TPA: FAD-dependent oxidoreductase [Dongiaceae bacterium]|nr:FAD-dependent oxidoreductase [Dongiaceae bacterium]